MEILVICAAPPAALPRRVLSPIDAVEYPVHSTKCLFKSDQVRAGPNNRPLLVLVVEMTQPAEVFFVPRSPDLRQAPTVPGVLTTRAAAVTSRRSLLLVLLNGSLPGGCLNTDGAPDWNRVEPLGVGESPRLGNVLGNGGW